MKEALLMVKNHKLAKSISDASWSMFTDWLDYFGRIHGRFVYGVPPHYTSQKCSNCGEIAVLNDGVSPS